METNGKNKQVKNDKLTEQTTTSSTKPQDESSPREARTRKPSAKSLLAASDEADSTEAKAAFSARISRPSSAPNSPHASSASAGAHHKNGSGGDKVKKRGVGRPAKDTAKSVKPASKATNIKQTDAMTAKKAAKTMSAVLASMKNSGSGSGDQSVTIPQKADKEVPEVVPLVGKKRGRPPVTVEQGKK